MSHIEKHLLPGETIIYRARLHGVALVAPAILGFFFVIGMMGAAVATTEEAAAGPAIGLAYILMFGLPAVLLFMNYRSAEFAVTSQRVIMKVGWIRRRTLETALRKVEGIGGEETLLGRMLGYGTIIVTGSGGTRETFRRISSHETFRKAVQEQMRLSAEDDRRPLPAPSASQMGGVTAAPSVALGAREERDCPWCAERILSKARVCKHCSREVGGAPV